MEIDEKQAAARILWHDLLGQAEKDRQWLQGDTDYADRFREFDKFYLWLCLHGYKPGMTLARKNPCDPFYPRNCVLRSSTQNYDPIAEKLRGHRTVSGTVNADSRLYEIWRGVKKRCLNPKCKDYPDYGGRGIRLCNEWLSFPVFATWAWEHGYAVDLSIDRIDVNGNYCPDNCRWASYLERRLNQRITGKTYRNIRLTVKRMRDFLQNMPDNAVVTLIARRDCLPDCTVVQDDFPAIPEPERIDTRRNHGRASHET